MSAVSLLVPLILSLGMAGHVWAVCPDKGCPPFDVRTEVYPYLPDSLNKYLNLQPEKPMQVELLPRDTGMTWEYHYASYSNNRSVIIEENYLLRLKLITSKDSGAKWVSRWRYGYQGWRSATYVGTTLTDIPWTAFDTLITSSKDSGIVLEAFLPFRQPMTHHLPPTGWMMRPLVTDTLAVGPCCNHPIAKGQSEGDLYALSRKGTAIYQKDRGIIFFGYNYGGPDVQGHTRASLSYYGREPGPVPVRQVFQRERHLHRSKRSELFRANEYLPFNVLGRTMTTRRVISVEKAHR